MRQVNFYRNIWVDLDFILVEMTNRDEIEIDTEKFIQYYNTVNEGIHPMLTVDNISRTFVSNEIAEYMRDVLCMGEVEQYATY